MLRRIIFLLVHFAAAVVPMLVGWGVGDLAHFVEEPVRTALLAAILACAGAVLILQIDLNPVRAGKLVTSNERWMLTAMALASVALLCFLPFADRHHFLTLAFPGVRWLGLLLCCAGGVVRILALRQLGPQFSAFVTLQPDHQLVQSGIYSRVRHPLYLSLLLAGPGVALVFASQLVWPILALTVAFVASRIRVEESLLGQHFGPQFQSYRCRSRLLIPLLW